MGGAGALELSHLKHVPKLPLHEPEQVRTKREERRASEVSQNNGVCVKQRNQMMEEDGDAKKQEAVGSGANASINAKK